MSRPARRAGFTLIETLVALTLLGVLITMTLAALDRQVRLFTAGSTQMDAIQNGRFAMSSLEKDLPTTGTNIANRQPFMVYADSNVVVFNADYLSNRLNDVSAIYVDTSASDLYASAVTRARRFRIPGSSVQYPDSNYYSGAQNSPAETIVFFMATDSTTERNDDYILYRQVNDQAPDLLARGLLHTPGLPFFQYQRRVTPASGNPYLQVVAASALPLRHVQPLHGAPEDTGAAGFIDQLRAVTVNFRVSDDQPVAKQRVYMVTRTIALPNAGLGTRMTCGDEPILGSVGFAATVVVVDGQSQVQLTWLPAMDESSGEKDVLRYVIYRSTGIAGITDPLLSIPAGQASYTYLDATVSPGVTYYYSMAAQDCTPALSDPVAAAAVIP